MTDEREHWRNLLEEHRKALQVLELQATQFGKLMVPPHIVTEIQDRKEKIADLEAKLAAAPPVPGPEAPPAERGEEQAAPGHPSLDPEMILIPAGEFLMGSDPGKDKDALDPEQPQHTLYLPDYYMAKTPVTNVQYAEFVRDAGLVEPPRHWRKGEPPPDKLKHPVVDVSWRDAMAYCTWLADVTGKPYRLPSEAEWEKAARGTDGRIYPWGNRWYPRWCNTSEGGVGSTTPVGSYPRGASPYGLLDMAGNVWEWCLTKWWGNYEGYAKKERELQGVEGTAPRVLRGGSWSYDRADARCAYRYWNSPYLVWYSGGFRVMVSPILF